MPKAKKTSERRKKEVTRKPNRRKKTTKQKEFSFFTRVMNGAKRIFSPKY